MEKPSNPGGLGALGSNAKPTRAVLGAVTGLLFWIILAWALSNAVSLWKPVFDTAILGAVFLPSLLVLAVGLLVISPLAALFYARLYGKSLGGYSGDALGASIETAEILSLLAARIILALW
jgi:adenosylcobinamide-GDP ribazoletransferase